VQENRSRIKVNTGKTTKRIDEGSRKNDEDSRKIDEE